MRNQGVFEKKVSNFSIIDLLTMKKYNEFLFSPESRLKNFVKNKNFGDIDHLQPLIKIDQFIDINWPLL
jgi:hypothetical protein